MTTLRQRLIRLAASEEGLRTPLLQVLAKNDWERRIRAELKALTMERSPQRFAEGLKRLLRVDAHVDRDKTVSVHAGGMNWSRLKWSDGHGGQYGWRIIIQQGTPKKPRAPKWLRYRATVNELIGLARAAPYMGNS